MFTKKPKPRAPGSSSRLGSPLGFKLDPTGATIYPPYVMPPASGLLAILRTGVAIADTTTKSLKMVVTFRKHLGDDGYGGDTFGPEQKIGALVEKSDIDTPTGQGVLLVQKITLTILNIQELMRVTNGDGLQVQDEFTLLDGTMGVVATISGFLDAGTGQPVATEAELK